MAQDIRAQDIRKVGVIGAGQMGSGIAHVCALAGFDVKLHDVSADRVKQALATINGNMARQVAKKAITEEQRQAGLAKIAPADAMDAAHIGMQARQFVDRLGGAIGRVVINDDHFERHTGQRHCQLFKQQPDIVALLEGRHDHGKLGLAIFELLGHGC